jgi:hypothetical protein
MWWDATVQGGRVVVRVGGGYLKLEDFIARYGAADMAPDALDGDDSHVATVVRRSHGVALR